MIDVHWPDQPRFAGGWVAAHGNPVKNHQHGGPATSLPTSTILCAPHPPRAAAGQRRVSPSPPTLRQIILYRMAPEIALAASIAVLPRKEHGSLWTPAHASWQR